MAKRFFENRAWFNKLFHDLKVLLDKITSQIDGYENKSFYYYKPKDLPFIIDFYSIFLTGTDNKLNLNITAVLDDNVVENPHIRVEEPVLFIVLHTDNDSSAWVTDCILKNNHLDKNEEKEGMINGIIDWGGEYGKVKYYSFVVPLDKFSEYSDELAKELIVDRIDELQDKFGNAS